MPFKVAAILVAAVGLCACVSAQFPVSESLEARVDASGIVVLGTIGSMSRTPEPDSREKLTLVVEVSETLKGAPVKSLNVSVDTNSPPDGYLDWQEKKTPVLWFVDPAPVNGKADPVNLYVQGLTGGPGKQYPPGSPAIVHWVEALGGSESQIHVIDMDFQILRTQSAVLDRVRQAVKEMPGPNSVTLIPPWMHPDVFNPDPDPSKRPTMHWFTYVPHYLKVRGVYLAMPICPRLESLAQKLIADPGSVLRFYRADNDGWKDSFTVDSDEDAAKLRAAAIGALAYFKSPDNIKLVRKYLNDPYITSGQHPQRIVQDAARWLLSGWGVEIPTVVRGR